MRTSRRVVLPALALGLALLLALIRPAGSAGAGLSFRVGAAAPGERVEVAAPRRGAVAASFEAPGTVRAGGEVALGAAFEGRVQELVKDEGDRVEAGQVLFRLDPTDQQHALARAEVDLARNQHALVEARIELAEAERAARTAEDEPSDLTEARLRARQSDLQAQRAQAQLESAQTNLDHALTMQREGIGREIEVETARDEFRIAGISQRLSQEELRLARETLTFRERTWAEARAGAAKTLAVSQARVSKAEDDLRQTELALEAARRDLARCEVKTPISGVVTGRGVNAGDLVSRLSGDAAHYIVSDLDRIVVYTDVDEGDVVRVREGQPARVRVQALGGELTLRGAVYDVGYRPNSKAGQEAVTFLVRILLEPGQEALARLRPGMSASVTIETGRVEDALKLPLQAVVQRTISELPEALRQTLADRPADDLVDVVYVVIDGQARVRLVTLGLQDGEDVEVVSGLGAESQVVTGPFRRLEALRDGNPVRIAPPVEAAPVASAVAAR